VSTGTHYHSKPVQTAVDLKGTGLALEPKGSYQFKAENTKQILQFAIGKRQLPEQDKEQEGGVAAEGQSVQGQLDARAQQKPKNQSSGKT
jgi:hypothetical protein